MNFSARHERIEVAEMGLKSDNELGLGYLGIGVTMAVRQFEGTIPGLLSRLTRLYK